MKKKVILLMLSVLFIECDFVNSNKITDLNIEYEKIELDNGLSSVQVNSFRNFLN